MLTVMLMVQVLVAGTVESERAIFFVNTGQLGVVHKHRACRLVVKLRARVCSCWTSFNDSCSLDHPRDGWLVCLMRWQRYQLRPGWHCLVDDIPVDFEQKIWEQV